MCEPLAGYRPVGEEGRVEPAEGHPQGTDQEGPGQLAPSQLVEGGATQDLVHVTTYQDVVIVFRHKKNHTTLKYYVNSNSLGWEEG